jgi:hypothetical protein
MKDAHKARQWPIADARLSRSSRGSRSASLASEWDLQLDTLVVEAVEALELDAAHDHAWRG